MSNGSLPESWVKRESSDPSWWPITTKEKWQDAVQSRNFDLACQCRAMAPDRAYTMSIIGQLLGIPEWLVMCLVGMPTGSWWHLKQERDCPSFVRLP